ncbi:histone methyltransferase set1 [Sporothrix curviconia]|uniref:Histone methyltransferase set1 n=1 Tax=Sporothrix curviconia TaxID=1260050 RepID=A0ABP0ANQ8_9PEZI
MDFSHFYQLVSPFSTCYPCGGGLKLGLQVSCPSERGRSPAPEKTEEQLVRDEKAQKRKDEEGDLEEEKRQRAKNFDPVAAAVESVRLELVEHLIRHIRADVAAPLLFTYLDPATPQRRHNINGSRLPALLFDDDDTERRSKKPSPINTPNSRASPIERRTARLNVAALPCIRKAMGAKKLAAVRKQGLLDPFARQRTQDPASSAFRSLHYRLKDDSDEESEDETDAEGRAFKETLVLCVSNDIVAKNGMAIDVVPQVANTTASLTPAPTVIDEEKNKASSGHTDSSQIHIHSQSPADAKTTSTSSDVQQRSHFIYRAPEAVME